jgi:8-oxo-dGTP diphosphatase
MTTPVLLGVAIFVFDEHNRLLLGKRKSKHGEGTWGTPGGHVEFGEDPVASARRELLEETGLTLDLEFCTYSSEVFSESGKHYVSLYFRAVTPIAPGTVKVCEPDKLERWAFFPLDQLPAPLFFPYHEVLQRCLLLPKL